MTRSLTSQDVTDSAITLSDSIISIFFPTILFGLKFVEWWYSPEKEETIRKITQLPIPPAPPAVQVSSAQTDKVLLLFSGTMLFVFKGIFSDSR